MLLINWLELQPLLADLDTLNERLQESLPVRKVCQLLAEITMCGYPWLGRSDLIPCYHPSRTYKPGQWIALPVVDPQNRRPTVWQVAQVQHAEIAGNPVQGRFQALLLDVNGKQVHKVGGIPEATSVQPEISAYSDEELGWLGEWVADTYVNPLLATLRKLIQKGRVCGQIAGDTYLPEQLFTLSQERLHPFFGRLSSSQRWLSIEEILQGLPDLTSLKRETALSLLRSTLKASPYRSLGGDRWTTDELFNQLDREVPRGLPAPHLRSKETIWTKQDKHDLAGYKEESMATAANGPLEELVLDEERSAPDPLTDQPPTGPIRLPALNYHHIIQAYFPIREVLPAFSPDAGMVFVQFIDGDHQPFLLDRESGLLKAVHSEGLRTRILEGGIPAGTHLWLEDQGDGKYRIFPQPLTTTHGVPCKIAYLEGGELHIQQTQIQMDFESDPTVFKAEMGYEEIELLFEGARQASLSVRDALSQAIQKICAVDPCHRARRSDIFNTVFLMRVCSPDSVSVLLHSQACFEQLEEGYFRFRPVLDRPAIGVRKRINLSRLWEDLIAYQVPPEPAPVTAAFLGRACDLVLPAAPGLVLEAMVPVSPVRLEISVGSSSLGGKENRNGESKFEEEAWVELPHSIEQEPVLYLPGTEASLPYDRQNDRDESSTSGQLAFEKVEYPARSIKDKDGSKPASTESPAQMQPFVGSTIDTRRIAYGLKIPARPLHKRPMYQRVLFCLHGWMEMFIGRSRDHTPR